LKIFKIIFFITNQKIVIFILLFNIKFKIFLITFMTEYKQNIILNLNFDYDKMVKSIQNVVCLAYLMRKQNKSLVR